MPNRAGRGCYSVHLRRNSTRQIQLFRLESVTILSSNPMIQIWVKLKQEVKRTKLKLVVMLKYSNQDDEDETQDAPSLTKATGY